MNIKWPSSSLLMNFNLKFNFFNSMIVKLRCFGGPFIWKIFCQPFFEVISIFLIKMSFWYASEGWILSLYGSWYPLSFRGKLNPLTLWDINDHCLLFIAVFWFVVGSVIVCRFPDFSSFGVLESGIIYCCVFVSVVKFLGRNFPYSTFCRAGYVDMYYVNLVL